MPFSKETLAFLVENRMRNSRDWFLEQKPVYERFVLAPLRELVTALTPGMLEIDSLLTVEPQVDRTICRIRRDTRFSHDKSLYRETMWIIFKRGKMHGTEVPGLYFEISPEGFRYGGGFYHASTGYMETMRRRILEGGELFRAARRAYEAQTVFRIEGDCYKRPHFPEQPQELRQWLERRDLYFEAESRDFDLLFSAGLAEKLGRDFKLFAPVYRFLLDTAQEDRGGGAARF